MSEETPFELKVGDVVASFAAPRVPMTVREVDDGWINCDWFTDGLLHRERFPRTALLLYAAAQALSDDSDRGGDYYGHKFVGSWPREVCERCGANSSSMAGIGACKASPADVLLRKRLDALEDNPPTDEPKDTLPPNALKHGTIKT